MVKLLNDQQKIGQSRLNRGHSRDDGEDLALELVQEIFQPVFIARHTQVKSVDTIFLQHTFPPVSFYVAVIGGNLTASSRWVDMGSAWNFFRMGLVV